MLAFQPQHYARWIQAASSDDSGFIKDEILALASHVIQLAKPQLPGLPAQHPPSHSAEVMPSCAANTREFNYHFSHPYNAHLHDLHSEAQNYVPGA